MTTADKLSHNPVALFWHLGKCFLRRNLHRIKTGSHSHILIHSQVQILLIHVSWGATPLDFLKLVKVKLSLSKTQPTPENQHSLTASQRYNTTSVCTKEVLGFSANHFLFTCLTQGARLYLPSQVTWRKALPEKLRSSIKPQDAPTSLLLESLKFQNLCSVFKHATSVLLTSSRRTDPWPGQEGERLYKIPGIWTVAEFPKNSRDIGFEGLGFLVLPSLIIPLISHIHFLWKNSSLLGITFIYIYFLCMWPFGFFTLGKTKPRHGKSR